MTLIERIEAAEEGSRELDAEIATDVLGWTFKHITEKGGARWTAWWREFNGKKYRVQLPHYTTSLDDALQLVLEGYVFSISDATKKARANVWRLSATNETPPDYSKAATPALALCVAALKARAETGET